MKKLIALAICLVALSAPALGQDQASPNAAETTAAVKEPAPPAPEEALKENLARLVIGNQGAILKIWKVGETVPDYYRGLDDRDTAPYSEQDHTALAVSLGMDKSGLEQAALMGIDQYESLPKRNVIAFLGLVNSIGEESPLDSEDEIDAKVRQFLVDRLTQDGSVIMRRQACLALAVGDHAHPEVVEAVIGFYSSSENLWETFPVQQFFQYHAKTISSRPDYNEIREKLASVNSLYTANILGYLDEAKNLAASNDI